MCLCASELLQLGPQNTCGERLSVVDVAQCGLTDVHRPLLAEKDEPLCDVQSEKIGCARERSGPGGGVPDGMSLLLKAYAQRHAEVQSSQGVR